MPIQSKLARVIQSADFILSLLEKLSEESFYEGLLGQRLVTLLKRYFGNDVVVLSFVFYISTFLRTNFVSLITYIFRRQRSVPTVSVKVNSVDGNIYYAIDHFVRKQQVKVKNATLKTAIANYDVDTVDVDDYDDDGYSYDSSNITPKKHKLPVVEFYPPDGVVTDLYYNGHKLSVVRHDGSDDKDQEESNNVVGEHWEITMEGNSLDELKAIIQEWSDSYNERGQGETTVYKANSYGNWMHVRSMEPRPLETVTLKADFKEKIIKDMETFKRRRLWYTRRGIPYRRGYLLHGPPGTGKTSLIQAVAGKLGMNVGIINLSEVTSDSNFADTLSSVPFNTLIVLEDFDRYMAKSGKTDVNGVTLAGILNGLDGIHGQTGSMVFMTCNNIEKLDPAILRPGRMDVKLLLDYAEREQIEEMYWRFFGCDYETMEPVEGDRKDAIKAAQIKFSDAIPPKTVTTAELESFIITTILAASANNVEEVDVYESILKDIPSFLEKIAQSRLGVGITSFNEGDDKSDDKSDENEKDGEETASDDGEKKEGEDETKKDGEEKEGDEKASETDAAAETQDSGKSQDTETAPKVEKTPTVDTTQDTAEQAVTEKLPENPSSTAPKDTPVSSDKAANDLTEAPVPQPSLSSSSTVSLSSSQSESSTVKV